MLLSTSRVLRSTFSRCSVSLELAVTVIEITCASGMRYDWALRSCTTVRVEA
jgi:hypothetical protein